MAEDWQISKKQLKQRGEYILETGQWSDCSFIVGNEPDQKIFLGHKLILAMSSPVFEAMFYGVLAEQVDHSVAILDVQPEAFKALLEYIYTDKVVITSFDQACELCYAAKKYMLPHLVKECTNYLWSDLYPSNACRAYEFAKLFDEPMLMKKSLQIIRDQTKEVLNDSSFEDASLSTVVTIFLQDYLNIDSELELFEALTRYSLKHGKDLTQKLDKTKSSTNSTTEQQNLAPLNNNSSSSETQSISNAGNNENNQQLNQSENEPPLAAASSPSPNPSSSNQVPSSNPVASTPPVSISPQPSTYQSRELTIRDALCQIRFLTLTPSQFADGPAMSDLFTDSERFNILMNISSSMLSRNQESTGSCFPSTSGNSNIVNSRNTNNASATTPAMPCGFSTSRKMRTKPESSLPIFKDGKDRFQPMLFSRDINYPSRDASNLNRFERDMSHQRDRNLICTRERDFFNRYVDIDLDHDNDYIQQRERDLTIKPRDLSFQRTADLERDCDVIRENSLGQRDICQRDLSLQRDLSRQRDRNLSLQRERDLIHHYLGRSTEEHDVRLLPEHNLRNRYSCSTNSFKLSSIPQAAAQQATSTASDAVAAPAPLIDSIPSGVVPVFEINSSQIIRGSPKFYLNRTLIHEQECLNSSGLDVTVSFTSDASICIVGIQVPTQVTSDLNSRQLAPLVGNMYSELLYAHLVDADGSRLTYLHYSARVQYGTMMDLTFNRPVYIQRGKVYKVNVVCNRSGWYPIGPCAPTASMENVTLTFANSDSSVRDGLVRAIIFSW